MEPKPANTKITPQDVGTASADAGGAGGSHHGGDAAAGVTIGAASAPEAVETLDDGQAAGASARGRLQHPQQQTVAQQHGDEQHDGYGGGQSAGRREYMAQYQRRYPASYHEAGFGEDEGGSGN